MKISPFLVVLILSVFLFQGCSHLRQREGAWEQTGTASWYGSDFHGKPTATGEPYDMFGISAAHRTLPLGSTVRVTHLGNRRQIVIPINDRGPFVSDRIIDLSYGAAEQLGMTKEGLAKVHIEVVKMPRSINERYTLQFGAFTERQNAVALAEKLRKLGYNPEVEGAYAHGRYIYRVRIGAFGSLQPAQNLAGIFSSRGISCIIIG